MNRQPCHAGATLVELLVGLAISSLIIAALILAHHTLHRNASGQLERLMSADAANYTIQSFRDDLMQLFATAADDECAIELENSATNLIRLGFCRWEHTSGRDFPMTNRLERVDFFSDPATNRSPWVRVRKALVGVDATLPPITNRLDGTWPRLVIHLHDGKAWQTNWIAVSEARPQAARIILLNESHQTAYETVVVIPSGLHVSSTVMRAGASAIMP